MALVLGIDEAGRGPLIGPMVMAGVLADEADLAYLAKIGVKDSKMLSRAKRNELFIKIKEIANKYEIVVVSPEEIDNAVNSGKTNLNYLEADKSAEIINKIGNGVKAFIDCPSNNIENYKAYLLKAAKVNANLVVEHKADEKYIVVSAASILAKVTRDNEIDKLKKAYGDFGSGYPSDPRTVSFLKQNPDLPIYRKSWATWQNYHNGKSQKKIFEF